MTELPEVIPAPVRALIELYDELLKSVKFPDVDSAQLGVAAREVATAATKMEDARRALAAAEAELDAQQEALLAKAHRALAYARIYGEDAPDLAARLAGIALPKLGRKARAEPSGPPAPNADAPAPRRRGRPPKVSAPSLFSEQGDAAGEQLQAV